MGPASEQYAPYPLLRHYVNVVVGDDDTLATNKNSFLAGCKVVDLWKMSKLKQLDVATLQEMMKPAVADFLQKHIAAYGVRCVRPKHHWLFDVIITALRNGTSLDMFILERLHLRVKPEGELMRNTSSFEEGVLALVLCRQLHDLENGELHDGLRGRHVACPWATGARISDALISGGMNVHVDDVVFCGRDAGVCLACLDDAGELLLLVELLELKEELSPQSASWLQTTRRAFWSAESCELAPAWREEGGNSLVVIRI